MLVHVCGRAALAQPSGARVGLVKHKTMPSLRPTTMDMDANNTANLDTMNWGLDTMKEKGVEDVAPTPTPSPAARTAHQTPDVSPALHASSATSALKPNNDDVSYSSKRSLPAYSTAQPATKKATTTIASQMKDSLVDLVESDNEDGVVESGVEGATASDESIEWLLCPATGVQSEWWNYFRKFNRIKHKGMMDKAACVLCFEAKQ